MRNRVVLALYKGNITMRKWGTLVLTVLLVLAFLPAGFGILAKKSLDQLVIDLPVPEGVTLSVQNYMFGWLNSYVAIKVHLPKNAQRSRQWANEAIDITVHGHIAHGPFVMTDKGLRIGLARLDTHASLKDIQGLHPVIQNELALFFKDNDLLRASSVFHFTKGMSIDLKSSPIHAKADGDNIQWNGFNAHIQINKDFDKLHTDLIISPVLFATKNGAMLDAAQGQFLAQLSRDEGSALWVGTQVFKLPTLYLKDESGSVLRFDHLRIMSNSNIIDQLLQASLDIEADNIEVDNQVIEQLRFDLELSDFASKPLLALGQLMHKPQPWLPADRKEIFKLTTQTLLPGADIEMDYMLNMQQNQVFLRGMLNFPNVSDKVDENEVIIAQQLLQDLNARLEFMAPQEVVKELLYDMTWSALVQQMGEQKPGESEAVQIKQMTDNQIQGLVQNNVLIARDNNYYLIFDYQQGQINLNGQVMTQGELFLLLMLLLQATPNESPAP